MYHIFTLKHRDAGSKFAEYAPSSKVRPDKPEANQTDRGSAPVYHRCFNLGFGLCFSGFCLNVNAPGFDVRYRDDLQVHVPVQPRSRIPAVRRFAAVIKPDGNKVPAFFYKIADPQFKTGITVCALLPVYIDRAVRALRGFPPSRCIPKNYHPDD